MNFKKSTQFYLTLFFILGFSPYQPNDRGSFSIMFICYIFKFVQATTCEIAGIVALYIVNGVGAIPHHSHTEIILRNMYLICDLMRAIFILMKCIFFKHFLNEILDLFENLESYFAIQLNHRISYRNFFKLFTFKLFLILGLCALYLFSFFMRWMVGDRLSQASIILKILQRFALFFKWYFG